MSKSTNETKRTILVAGAGKSSIYLIHYLLTHATRNKWHIIVADNDLESIRQKIGDHPAAEAVQLDILNVSKRQELVANASLVVSLMPPQLHIHLAKDCLQFGKNLITSSYISEEMREMDSAVKEAGLMFMCEMGLDPGIDHMTASYIMHGIHRSRADLTSFKSYCGGLIAPESDDNPWHYKFSWNPRNIITAGADGAAYLEDKKDISVPYGKMFENNKNIGVKGVGELAYYPNRDSLRYLDIYEVPDIQTFLRATLRHPDFCKGWQAMITLGLTVLDDHIDTNNLTYGQWVMNKAGYAHGTREENLRNIGKKTGVAEEGKVLQMLEWLGLFDEKKIASAKTSSGEILLDILLDKWQMSPTDKDMVVMQHEVIYIRDEKAINLTSTMVLKGENREFSAMAKTVGLPMGILARAVMNNKLAILPTGVHIPNMQEVYKPVLKELEYHGIRFYEEVR